MGIGDEVAGRAEWFEEFSNELEMAVAGCDHGRTRLGKPAVDDVERLRWRQRRREDTAVRGKANEREEDREWQPERLHAGEPRFEPRLGRGMPRRRRIDGVDEQVDVGDLHEGAILLPELELPDDLVILEFGSESECLVEVYPRP